MKHLFSRLLITLFFSSALLVPPPLLAAQISAYAEKDTVNYSLIHNTYATFGCCGWDGGECGCSAGTIVCCNGQLSFCPCSDLDS